MSDIETQDTEPLTPDAARIVELERQLERTRLSLDVEEMAHGIAIQKAMALQQLLAAQAAVMKAALALPYTFLDDGDLRIGSYCLCAEYAPELMALCRAVDTLQPKG